MAPEVVRSEEYYQQCDMWSVGVILYVMLAGCFPFCGKTKEETFKLINEGVPKFTGSFGSNEVEPSWRRISAEAKDLVKRFLQLQPEKRPSATEALKDIWIQKFAEPQEGSNEELFSGLKNLESFRTQKTFQKAVLAYIASQELSQTEEKKLKEAFNSLDKDNNGIITKDELIEGYMKMGKSEKAAIKEADWVMRRIDINQNGAIDYNEFLMANLAARDTLSKSRLKKAFEFFDLVYLWMYNRMEMDI